MASDFNALADSQELNAEDDYVSHQEKERLEREHINSLMHRLVADNQEAMKYLHERFVQTAIAAPGDTYLEIGLKQGQANMILTLFKMAEANQEK